MTDHLNSTYIMSPTLKNVRKSSLSRVQRWSLMIRETRVLLQFIKGSANVLADLLSRWGYPDLARTCCIFVARTLFQRKREDYHLTLSPGWTSQEIGMLKRLIKRFGLGNWSRIIASGYLPGKTVSQLVSQTSKLIGQQSLWEFKGFHINVDHLKAFVDLKQGIRRKGLLIHSGNNKSRQEIKQLWVF